MKVVSDTSPICYLFLIGHIDLLPSLFNYIFIPEAVCFELKDKGAPAGLRNWMNNPPAWLKVQDIAASHNLANVMFIPFQSLNRLAESLSIADVSLIGIYPENEGAIMPSKLYGLLAVGKPIICVSDPKSEVVEILNQAKAGLHSSIDDPKELAQKIMAILDDLGKAKEMGENGRRYFLEHFERRRLRGNGKSC